MENLESKTLEFKWLDWMPGIGIYTFNKRNASKLQSENINPKEMNMIGHHSMYQITTTLGAIGLSLIGIFYAADKLG